MKKYFITLSLAATALVPAAALAQSSCEQQRSTRVVATVGGAGIGAVIGSSVAGRGDRTLGAIIGGVGGGLLGNQIARPSDECKRAFGYYDRDARWHASNNPRADMTGYIDRDGQWVDGAPNGNYGRDGRWQANVGNGGERGYYDGAQRWVPAGETGYYGDNDQWQSARTTGRYDGGMTTGIAVRGDMMRADRPNDIRGEIMWLDRSIRHATDSGTLGRRDGRQLLGDLQGIDRQERGLRHYRGTLSPRDTAMIRARLDRVSAGLDAGTMRRGR